MIGYTDTETVKLDFDHTPFKEVKYWALKTLQWFKLGGCLILKSSENSYHAVFDRTVTWAENMRIVAWVSLLSNNRMLEKWFVMQCIKKGSTLRISPKKDKTNPRIVYRYREQDNEIKNYLDCRKTIKKMLRN